jgi:hypothetical protein
VGVNFGEQAGMSFDPVTGTLYAAGTFDPVDLYTINLATGLATAVRPTGLSQRVGGVDGFVFQTVPEPGCLLLLIAGAPVLLRGIRKAA